jgi:hypothetical protein
VVNEIGAEALAPIEGAFHYEKKSVLQLAL